MIGIIDYGMGNLRSVQKALERTGADASILTVPDEATAVERLVLPGVGAFADGMEHLEERGWIEPIRTFIATGRPVLGICLGMQLFFQGSQEDAVSPDKPVSGLGVMPGRVVAFRQPQDGPRIKIPHMGWNTLAWDRDDPLMKGLDPGCAVYFVHGYYAQPSDPALVTATADYPQGRPFCASVWRENVWATQFHPEKSQRVGLRMLENFATLTVPA